MAKILDGRHQDAGACSEIGCRSAVAADFRPARDSIQTMIVPQLPPDARSSAGTSTPWDGPAMSILSRVFRAMLAVLSGTVLSHAFREQIIVCGRIRHGRQFH